MVSLKKCLGVCTVEVEAWSECNKRNDIVYDEVFVGQMLCGWRAMCVSGGQVMGK